MAPQIVAVSAFGALAVLAMIVIQTWTMALSDGWKLAAITLAVEAVVLSTLYGGVTLFVHVYGDRILAGWGA